MQVLNNWGPALVVILGYVIGYYFQNKRLDDFRENMNSKFADLYKYIDVKFEMIDLRFKALEDRLDKIDKRLDRLEETTKLVK